MTQQEPLGNGRLTSLLLQESLTKTEGEPLEDRAQTGTGRFAKPKKHEKEISVPRCE